MAGELIDPQASWIWLAEPNRRYNVYACFRRTIQVVGAVSTARLRLTADARYEVYVNGEWIGHGPPRSWPEPWPVDEYDLRSHLRPGTNVIAVLVTHFGIGTMQYLLESPGLLAQVDWLDQRGAHRVVTDQNWRALPHPGYQWPTPRASIPLAWEEQFDARTPLSRGWQASDFDDTDWPSARPIRKVGVAPHATLELRDIPPLTRDPVEPTQLLRAEVVQTAPYVWSLLLRDELGLGDDASAVAVGRLLVVSYIHSPCDQQVQLEDPHQLSPWPGTYWKLNGQRFGAPDPNGDVFQDLSWGGTARHVLPLREGWNILLGRTAEVLQVFRAVLTLRCDHPITFHATPDRTDTQQPPWLVLGPFGGAPGPDSVIASVHRNAAFATPASADATAERYEAIWERGEPLAEDLTASFTRRLKPDNVAAVDVFALCASERVLESVKPTVRNSDALLNKKTGWCTIAPAPDGDVRLLLDYGQEIVGYHELEVDAPEGTIIDVHGFEFIQADGRHNLTDGMNNTFRYICREGHQQYRTFLRRGFRYCWVSIRNFSHPVRLRSLRAILSTYPFAEQGDFDCAAPMLTRIWKIGVHTVRCCAEDTYTDCPTYEQTHWIGDARNEAQVDLIANGDPRLSRHCWIQAARSLNRSPIVESHVPSAWQNLLPAWSFLWMRWAREHHLVTGDDAFAHEACSWLDRNVRGIEQHLNDKGLFEINAWNMFDWAPMDTPPDAIVTHQNCLAVLGLNDAAVLAETIGDAQRARHWRELAGTLTDAINRHLWDEQQQAYADCLRRDGTLSPVFSQQTQTAAYIADVARGERARRCRAIMADPPSGFVTAGSPFFMFFLLEAYAREGDIPQMVRLIRNYWGPQVEAGATTFWEMYHPQAKRMTRSHCHGWSAAPTVFLTQHVLGISPLAPGYQKVRVAPGYVVDWARGRVPTPHGVIHAEWRRSGSCLTLDLNVPSEIEAIVELPKGHSIQVMIGRLDRIGSNDGITTLATRTPRIQLVHHALRRQRAPGESNWCSSHGRL